MALAEAVEVVRVYFRDALLLGDLFALTTHFAQAALLAADVRMTNRDALEVLRIVCTQTCIDLVLLGLWHLNR
jgi:hypothetical protein